jgi:hypothetical protein
MVWQISKNGKQEVYGVGEMNTYIAPTSLNPGTMVHSIKYFSFSKVQSVGIDPTIGNVQDVFASDVNWCLVGFFVVCANVVINASLIVPQPTTSIFRGGAIRPSGHFRVVTGKV